MPTYEYRCPEGHTFELFQPMSAAPVADCPECGKAAERMLSAGAGFLFKGSGFYITDYRSDSYRKKAESESGGAPAKADSGETSPSSSSSSSSSSGEGADGGSGKKPPAAPPKKEGSGPGARSSSGAGSD